MFKTLQNAFKIKEIRKKLLFTFLMLIVIRLGSQLPVPGINTTFFADWFEQQTQTGDAFNFLDAFTGGSFLQMSILALNITPYITSSIIMQLMTIAIPKLEEMQRDGADGRKKIASITRYVTVALALIESSAMAIGFGRQGLLQTYNAFNVITVIVAMTAGSAFLMWIGEQITENGVGNGISIVLTINILSRIPQDITLLFEKFVIGKSIAKGAVAAIIIVAVILLMVVLVIVLNDGIVCSFFNINGTGVWSHILMGMNSNYWCDPTRPVYSIGLVVYIVLVILFAYFYTSITFNPIEIAENMKKQGGFIPGIRPGKPTSEYLTRVLNYIVFIGAVGLTIVCVVPYFFNGIFGANVSFSGTSLIIIVSVVLETIKQIESQMLVRNYKGFLND